MSFGQAKATFALFEEDLGGWGPHGREVLADYWCKESRAIVMDRGADAWVVNAQPPSEQRPRADGAGSSETFIEVAMIRLVLRRLASGA